jgi:hypothetical protein
MPGNNPQTLHLLDLRGWSWQKICHRTSIYEGDTPRDTREFTMMKMVWIVDMRDSEDKLGCVEVDDNLILQYSAVNRLRVMAGNLALAGVKFSVRYHPGREEKNSTLLADEGSTATTLIDQHGAKFRDVYMASPGDA